MIGTQPCGLLVSSWIVDPARRLEPPTKSCHESMVAIITLRDALIEEHFRILIGIIACQLAKPSCSLRDNHGATEVLVTGATENIQNYWVNILSGELCPFSPYALPARHSR